VPVAVLVVVPVFVLIVVPPVVVFVLVVVPVATGVLLELELVDPDAPVAATVEGVIAVETFGCAAILGTFPGT